MKSSSTTNTTTTAISSQSILPQHSMSLSISSMKTFNPIPTKPQSGNNPLLNMDSHLHLPSHILTNNNIDERRCATTPPLAPFVPPLDELVNDCFLHTINQLNDFNKITIVESFMEYLLKQHCSENLNFLIDIYKYEFYYNKLYNNHDSIDYRLNSTPTPSLVKYVSSSASVHSIIQPSYRSKRNSISTTCNSSTTQNDDGFGVFMSDDLDAYEYAQFNANIWEELKTRQLDNDSESEYDYREEEEEEVLINQWSYIMNTYIKYDSTCQINISQKLFNEIAEESVNNSIHNPLVLMKARNETFALLKENGYSSFVAKYKANSLFRSNNSTIPSSPTAISPLHQQHQPQQQSHSMARQLISPISPEPTPISPTASPILATATTSSPPPPSSTTSSSPPPAAIKPASVPSPPVTSKTTTPPIRSSSVTQASNTSTTTTTPTQNGSSSSSNSLFNKIAQLPSKKESSTSLSNLFFFRDLKLAAENTNRVGKVPTPPANGSHDTLSPSESNKDDSTLSFKFWSRRK